MVLSDDTGVELLQLHQELCSKLNLDSNISSSSWDTYESISKKFVLEVRGGWVAALNLPLKWEFLLL